MTEPSKNVYDVITERIIDLLKQGTVPWQKSWSSTNGESALPANLVSRKPYRGVNAFLLHAMPYSSPYWLTFKQATSLGGSVRKGERATPVVFWTWLATKELDAKGKPKQVPMLRYYSAFNVSQCDGIEFPVSEPKPERTERTITPIESAEAIVKAMPKCPAISNGGDLACYSPALDRVKMPLQSSFSNDQEYYGILFHELTHSTGHESRLARKGVSSSDGEWSSFGSAPYAREELVAEMGAAFLSAHSGIVDRIIDNSAAYIQSWLQRLTNDPKLVVTAAAQAQKASDFILNIQHQTETTKD